MKVVPDYLTGQRAHASIFGDLGRCGSMQVVRSKLSAENCWTGAERGLKFGSVTSEARGVTAMKVRHQLAEVSLVS